MISIPIPETSPGYVNFKIQQRQLRQNNPGYITRNITMADIHAS